MTRVTGTNIRFAPPIAASVGVAPPSNSVTASSPTTIASSTTMPSAMTKPISAMMLMPKPNTQWNIVRPSRQLTGTPTATHQLTRAFRNRKSVMTTSSRPDHALLPIIFSCAPSMSQMSYDIESSTPGGNVGRTSFSHFCTMFSPRYASKSVSRINVIWIAGRPSRVTMGCPSRGRRTTSAMSPRRTSRSP